MPPRRPTLLHVIVLLATAMVLPPTAGAAEALPPELLQRLEADRTAAEQRLKAHRVQVGKAARAHQLALAAAARAETTRVLAARVAALVDARVPAATAASLQGLERRASMGAAARQQALDRATERAAATQASALDADRRLRALRRASETADERDTTLGSWRFGSGGPAVSAASIDEYLASKASPLSGEGAAFLEAGVEHRVDPRLIVAIAGAESYFGITTCAPFNAWGWGCPSGPYRFRSWAHGIQTVTKGLRTGYLDDGLHDVGRIHLRYAPPAAANDPTGLNYAWPDNVARFLTEQGGDPSDIEGVLGPSR